MTDRTEQAFCTLPCTSCGERLVRLVGALAVCDACGVLELDADTFRVIDRLIEREADR